MLVAAPADRRFRRAHVKPAHRRRWGRRAWFRAARAGAIVGLLGYGGYSSASLVMEAPLLQVSRVVVRGNERLSNGEVLALLDGLRGQNILAADLAHWRGRLLTSPWVSDAALRRLLPGTVEVSIEERRPMGIGRLGHELYLVDARGMIIDEYGPKYADFDLPIIDGLATAPQEGAPIIDEGRADLAARLLNAVSGRRDLADRISQVDVSDRRNAVVLLEGESALVRLGDERFVERLQMYVDLAPALHERIPEIDYIDLRFDERVYVRPSGRLERTSVAPQSGRAPRPARGRKRRRLE